MTNEEKYKISTDSWIAQQKKQIEVIELSIAYIEKDILLKTEWLEIERKTLEHEKGFLVTYIESLK
jgi:hypothetical protein